MERSSSNTATACDACRVRKYKCSKERPTCRPCLRNNRQCLYSGKVVRSPLTRAYLTSIERRLHKLESLFAQRLPDVNIEQALESMTAVEIKQEVVQEAPAISTPRTEPDAERQESLSEALPDEADGFEWKEETTEFSDLTDGMAALSVEPTGIGYLGMLLVRPALFHCLRFGTRIDIWCCFLEIFVTLDERSAGEYQPAGAYVLFWWQPRQTFADATRPRFSNSTSTHELHH
jgi:Fungal Zn(2)-Cys(6) binuclear cluster domain/Gal4-like dimerisation domain